MTDALLKSLREVQEFEYEQQAGSSPAQSEFEE
jgi:phosphopantetheine adenylyltransferase